MKGEPERYYKDQVRHDSLVATIPRLRRSIDRLSRSAYPKQRARAPYLAELLKMAEAELLTLQPSSRTLAKILLR